MTERLEVTDHHVQELLAKASTLMFRKQGQDDDFACSGLTETVPDDLVRVHANVTGKALALDSLLPSVNGDTYGLELFDRERVFSCFAADDHAGLGVFGNGVAKRVAQEHSGMCVCAPSRERNRRPRKGSAGGSECPGASVLTDNLEVTALPSDSELRTTRRQLA